MTRPNSPKGMNINEAWQAAKTRFGRLKKAAHPLQIRKSLKYRAARKVKHVAIDRELAKYIDKLAIRGESSEHALAILAAERGERSYLQIPVSEARFLEVFARSIGARNILEVGTFKGFSTAFMARALPEGGIVLSCDEDSRPMAAARRFWNAMGVGEKIHFELGKASDVLKRLSEDAPSLEFFDMAFVDADKENYQSYLGEIMKLVRPGGSILVDNTLWKGLVSYDRPHDNGADHIKEFNIWLSESYGLQAVLIPAWDGLTLLVKK